MNKWIDFYEQFFPNRLVAQYFIEDLEAITDSKIPKHRAKIMMHQTQRLITLADDVVNLRSNSDSLQLMFLIICTENIAKLYQNYKKGSKSKHFVRKFFKELVCKNDQLILESNFFDHDNIALDLMSIVDIFYKIRCDVVHEGKYWEFHFFDKINNTVMLNIDPDITIHMSISELREIIGRACVFAIQQTKKI